MAEEEVIELAGREVRITSPDKVLFSERGETKLDLVRYYAAVAEPLLRTMGGRPVLMQRFPQGTRGAGPDGYRHGVSELAITAGAPIIPVHIEGSALVMPKGRGLNRRAKTKVTFARPLHPRPGETPAELTQRLHDAIES